MRNFFLKFVNKLQYLIYSQISELIFSDITVKFDKKWFENKSVAIIGGADSVLQEPLGSYIDSFDVVVRINKGVEVINTQHEYVGKRTDVLFHCLFEDVKNGGSPITPELWKEHNVEQLIFSHNIKYSSSAFNYFRNFLKKTQKNIKISQIPKFLFFKNKKITKPLGPTTGFIAINTIFNCSPNEIYLTGITFFKTPHNRSYRNVDLKDLDKYKMHDFHNVEAEYQHIKKLYNSSKIIKPDHVLEEIFRTN